MRPSVGFWKLPNSSSATPIQPPLNPSLSEVPLVASQMVQAYEGEGTLVASGPFNNLDSVKAKLEITNYLNVR